MKLVYQHPVWFRLAFSPSRNPAYTPANTPSPNIRGWEAQQDQWLTWGIGGTMLRKNDETKEGAGQGGGRCGLSAGTLIGLYFNQKYRILTIEQFARIAGFSWYHAAEVLRDLERWGLLGYFGYVGIPGHRPTLR